MSILIHNSNTHKVHAIKFQKSNTPTINATSELSNMLDTYSICYSDSGIFYCRMLYYIGYYNKIYYVVHKLYSALYYIGIVAHAKPNNRHAFDTSCGNYIDS